MELRKIVRGCDNDCETHTVKENVHDSTFTLQFALEIGERWKNCILRGNTADQPARYQKGQTDPERTKIDSIFKDNENVKRMQKYTRCHTARTSLTYARLTTDLFIFLSPLLLSIYPSTIRLCTTQVHECRYYVVLFVTIVTDYCQS